MILQYIALFGEIGNRLYAFQNVTGITLKAPITTAADDTCDTFPNYRKEIRYDIS